MADNFIGLTVAVTLNAPPHLQAQGLVANVSGRTLYLQDVFFPATGERLPSYNIDGSQIADIQIPSGSIPQSPLPNRPNLQQTSTSVNLRGGAALAASDSYLAQAQSSALLPAQPPSRQSFVDPAILSFTKKPDAFSGLGISQATTGASEVAHETPATPVKPFPSTTSGRSPPVESPFVGVPKQRQAANETPRKKSHVTATLTEPFNELRPPAESDSPDDTDYAAGKGNKGRRDSAATAKPNENIQQDGKDKRKKRGVRGSKKKNKPAQITAIQDRTFDNPETSPEAFRKQKGRAEGKNMVNPKTGWRATPILEESPRVPGLIGGNVAREAASASKQKNKRQKAMEKEAVRNGWATEDATDIQELGDFDFEGNLSRFDKRSVFNQIRNEDTTADEDRLVSHNRLPQAKPGTNGGKNLHPTENVLDQTKPANHSDRWSSSSFQSIVDDTYSRRAPSLTSTKRLPIRTSSFPQELHHDTSSLPSTSRATRASTTRPKKPSIASHTTSSPKPASARPTPPPSTSPYHPPPTHSHLQHPISPPSPLLPTTTNTTTTNTAITTTTTNTTNHHHAAALPNPARLLIQPTSVACPTLAPTLLTALEAFAANQHGLSAAHLAGAAARGIADTALVALDPGGRRLARENPNAAPVVVVLVGRHARGAGAVAAARWLRERGLRVLVGALGLQGEGDRDERVRREREKGVGIGLGVDEGGGEGAEERAGGAEEEEQEGFRREMDIFQGLGGRVYGWAELERRLKRLDAPPELIVDAIVGRAGWAELEEDERVRDEALGMVAWANRSRAECLAVEVPCGLHAGTGEIRIHEGEPLLLRPRFVVALGAPLVGLLHAMRAGEGADWRLSVVDVGLDSVWKRASKRAAAGALEDLLNTEGLDPWTVGQLAEFGQERQRVEFGARWTVPLTFAHDTANGADE